MQGSFPVTDFEMQMIKSDESVEQLKEPTEITFSKKTCAELLALIQNFGSLKCCCSTFLAFFISSLA